MDTPWLSSLLPDLQPKLTFQRDRGSVSGHGARQASAQTWRELRESGETFSRLLL